MPDFKPDLFPLQGQPTLSFQEALTRPTQALLIYNNITIHLFHFKYFSAIITYVFGKKLLYI